jgi:hypothetical protein
MKKPFAIPTPCLEDWNTMKIGIDSRFCESCHKNVVDFTKKSRQEIVEYLLTNYNKKVCGHIYPSQLDFNYSEFAVTINILSKKTKNTNLPFYLLSLGAMLFLNNQTEAQTTPQIPQQNISQNDSTKKCSKTIEDSEIYIGEVADLQIEGEEKVTDGIIALLDENTPRIHADTMPEFPGGIDSLHAFMQNNIVVPTYKKKEKNNRNSIRSICHKHRWKSRKHHHLKINKKQSKFKSRSYPSNQLNAQMDTRNSKRKKSRNILYTTR